MAFPILLKDSIQTPIPQVYVPNVGFVSLQASPNVTTDTINSNPSAPVAVSYSGYVALALPSTPRTASNNSADFDVSAFDQLLIIMTFTAVSGTSPTVQFFLDTKDTLGNYYAVWTGSVISVITNPLIVPIGAGLPNQVAFGVTARLRWSIGGTTPSWTFGGNVIGK